MAGSKINNGENKQQENYEQELAGCRGGGADFGMQAAGRVGYSLNVMGAKRQRYAEGALDFFAIYLIPIDAW